MTEGTRASGWRWVAWAIVVLASVTPIVAILATGYVERVGVIALVEGSWFLVVGAVYGFVGALIVSRQPRNSVGWMLMAVAIGISSSAVAEIVITEPTGAPSPGFLVLLMFGTLSWVFFIFPILHLLLTFPDGKLLSPRWRVLVVLEAAMAVYLVVGSIFSETIDSPDETWSVANPIGFLGDPGEPLSSVFNAALVTLTVGGLTAVVLRFRASRGVERLQMKWLLYAVLFFALVYGSAAILGGSELSTWIGGSVLLPLSLTGIAAAIGIAVLRFRLYEIDRILSRTVTYAVVVALLGGVFALCVVYIPNLVMSGEAPPWLVAGTTLAVAALFNPVRTRVQGWVDRRFNRSRYDAQRVMDGFAAGLRDRLDAPGLVSGWTDVVTETMQPETIGVWVRKE